MKQYLFLPLLLLLVSLSAPALAQTHQTDNIMNKTNIGQKLALYPMPLTVVGAEVNGKVNWLIVAHTGIIGHNRILVSMSKSHFTNQGIHKSKKLSINLVSREMLPKADYVGSVSGKDTDKSEVFGYHWGELISILLKSKRYSDAEKASEDEKYREQLYNEYKL